MKNYNLPTRNQCLAILNEHCVPPHIVKHNMAVAKLAVFLAQKLNEKGLAVDVDLTERACLLHDILRICDLNDSDLSRFEQSLTAQDKAKWQHLKEKYTGLCHEQAAYELLKDNFPLLALTIRKHRYSAILDQQEKPHTWEEKLLYYADKRVMHDKIVPLKDRLEEAHERNRHQPNSAAQNNIDTEKVDLLIFKLEEEIFDRIHLNPLDVTSEFIDRNKTSEA